jgi:hypothetical protein
LKIEYTNWKAQGAKREERRKKSGFLVGLAGFTGWDRTGKRRNEKRPITTKYTNHTNGEKDLF